MIRTQRTAAFDAKNRYDLPDVLPLSFEDFAVAMKAHTPSDPARLMESIKAMCAQLDTEIQLKVSLDVNKAAGDAAALSKIENRLKTTLARKGA